jgi:predicted amidohydrolase YtcJ
VHFASAAAFLEFNVMKVATQEEFAQRLLSLVDRLPAGEWIVGGLWGAYDAWQEGTAGGTSRPPFVPDLRALDGQTTHHPVFLRRFDDREFAANRAALLAAGIDPDDPSVAEHPDWSFEREPSGRLTGIVRGSGVAEFFAAIIPPPSRQRRLEQSRSALEVVRRAGVTNFSDMSDDLQLELYRELHAAGELTARVHFRFPLERWPELHEQGIQVGSGDPWIRLGGLKGHIDGIMGNSTARFVEPYDHQPENRGRWRKLMVDEEGTFVPGQFLDFMLGADAANLQLSIHAIGDEANRLLLDYLEELAQRNGPRDRRFRLVHAQVIAASDFARLGGSGVVAEVQPFHLSDDMRWMEERIGAARCEGAYAFRSIQRSGAVLSFGSDWPGTAAAEYPISPLLGIYAAVTRQTLQGEPVDGWYPAERISVVEALRAYTWGSSYANFEDDLKGTLEVGKLADITVLDRNLLDIPASEILDAQVIATIVDGRVAWRAD